MKLVAEQKLFKALMLSQGVSRRTSYVVKSMPLLKKIARDPQILTAANPSWGLPD